MVVVEVVVVEVAVAVVVGGVVGGEGVGGGVVGGVGGGVVVVVVGVVVLSSRCTASNCFALLWHATAWAFAPAQSHGPNPYGCPSRGKPLVGSSGW